MIHFYRIAGEPKLWKIQDKSNKKNDYIKSEFSKRRPMTWAQRLKRVFNIDVEKCASCGGVVTILDVIEDEASIKQIF